jgi:hypothetical protein
MAIKLEATYSKKLGLPNFSSHCYVVSLSTELTDLSQVEAESRRLYALLQHTVDKELEEVGYVPNLHAPAQNGNGHARPVRARTVRNDGATRTPASERPQPAHEAEPQHDWACSPKQRALILRIVSENKLDKDDVEAMARQLFGIGVKECDKMQASQIIEDLFEKVGQKPGGRNPWRQRA